MPRRTTKVPPLGTELVPRIVRMLPCLGCPRNARAIEEIAATYLACLHCEPPPRPDGRPLRFLPKACCRQCPEIDPEALVA